MKHLLALLILTVAFCAPAFADELLQEGRSIAFCSDTTPVCAVMKDGKSAEMYECQARRDQAVRILPGACWDAD